MANYYGITVLPTRVASPKDKPTVEKAVLDAAERGIIQRCRGITFLSLEEMNKIISDKLRIINETPYQKEPNYTRNLKFIELDLPSMKTLPAQPFEYYTIGYYTVNIDSHIEINHKCYSVPYMYVGKKVEVRIASSTLAILYNNQILTVHPRIDSSKQRYSTILDHLPSRHKSYLSINKSNFMNWSEKISPSVKIVIESIFKCSVTDEYAYRPCMALQRLYKKYGPTRFTDACEKSIRAQIMTYGFIKNLLESKEKTSSEDEHIIHHQNIRGKENYSNKGEAYD
jgi:hypothetical protein